MKQGQFILFAWEVYYPRGGMNDCCGYFEDAIYAKDFFMTSDHCENKERYQIMDTDTFEIVDEGNK